MTSQTTVVDVHLETPSITSLILKRPAGFTYQSGQFLNIAIPVENCDNRCNKRNSSLVSAPHEEYLQISMRHGVSRYKQTLETLKPGTEVTIMGPFGRFVLNDDVKPAVMLSGGIGMTPLYSMIKDATHRKLPKPITLIYSNAHASDVPFKKHLDELDAASDFITIHYTMTKDPTWKGLTGRIDAAMIKKIVGALENKEFYICGVPAMVDGLRTTLTEMGIATEHIHFEHFAGY